MRAAILLGFVLTIIWASVLVEAMETYAGVPKDKSANCPTKPNNGFCNGKYDIGCSDYCIWKYRKDFKCSKDGECFCTVGLPYNHQ